MAGREVAISLRTRHFREAEYRAALVGEAFSEAWRQARQMADNDAAVAAALRDYLRAALAKDLDLRIAFSGEPIYANLLAPDRRADPLDADLEALTEALAAAREAYAMRDFNSVGAVAKGLMAKHRLPPETFGKLAFGVLKANVEALQAAQQMTLGEVPAGLPGLAELTAPPDRLHPIQPPAPPPPPPAPAKPLASSMVEPFFVRREKRDKATHQVMNQERGTLARFLEVCGDMADPC